MKLKRFHYFILGLSISPTHPPNPPVPDSLQPNSTAPMVERGSRAPKPDAGGSVSGPILQKPFNLTRPKREQPTVNSSFPAILGTIWGKKHRIWRNFCQIRLDRTGSWTDRERSRRFSPFFSGFQRVSASLETDAHPTRNRPVKPNLRQFGYGFGTCLPDLRRISCGLGTNSTRPTRGQP